MNQERNGVEGNRSQSSELERIEMIDRSRIRSLYKQ